MSYRFTRDLQLQIKKKEKKNLMGFVFNIHGHPYVVNGRCTSGVLPSGVAELNWAIPTHPHPDRKGLISVFFPRVVE